MLATESETVLSPVVPQVAGIAEFFRRTDIVRILEDHVTKS